MHSLLSRAMLKTARSKTEESEDEESMDGKSKDEESDNWKSEVEESDDEKSKGWRKLWYRVPKNAIVGESCVVACRVCGYIFRDSCCADCGLSVGRALLKECTICGKEEEHSNLSARNARRNVRILVLLTTLILVLFLSRFAL
ncbi:unnamed protein product [Prunus armeniaca]|uniref:Uncharacterized protein n=1 Tax=Prunus armeniaca TaxID=36596 RepID=A0A6J5VAM0_PRUAR|nr:unnamed protein product [Prunus armeniaca]